MKPVKDQASEESVGRSPSDDEKKLGVDAGEFETLGRHELPLDPDAGLSEEEKARIVSLSSFLSQCPLKPPDENSR